jgi:sugar/nucleoside kinase (ribokinase family)
VGRCVAFDLVCFSYVAPALLLGVERYPEPDGGAQLISGVWSIGADGALVALMLAEAGTKTALVSNNLGASERRQVAHALRSAGVRWHRLGGPQDALLLVIEDAVGNRTWLLRLAETPFPQSAAALTDLVRARMAYVDCYEVLRPAALVAAEAVSASGVQLLVNLGGSAVSGWDAERLRACRPRVIQDSVPNGELDRARVLARELQDQLSPSLTVVTAGASGYAWADRRGAGAEPARKVIARCLHGAGAAFSAGLAAALLAGFGERGALHSAASRAASYCAGGKFRAAPWGGACVSPLRAAAGTGWGTWTDSRTSTAR